MNHILTLLPNQKHLHNVKVPACIYIECAKEQLRNHDNSFILPFFYNKLLSDFKKENWGSVPKWTGFLFCDITICTLHLFMDIYLQNQWKFVNGGLLKQMVG